MKFAQTSDGRPVWNQDLADAKRKQMIAMLYRTGQIQDKVPARSTTHDDWISKRRDKS